MQLYVRQGCSGAGGVDAELKCSTRGDEVGCRLPVTCMWLVRRTKIMDVFNHFVEEKGNIHFLQIVLVQ